MAGPSNPSYAPSPQCLNLTGPEKPPMNESLQSTPDVVEADEGGVEVIMVDDPQPQRGEKRQAGKPQECTDEPRCVTVSIWSRRTVALASENERPDSSPGHSIWDLWRAKFSWVLRLLFYRFVIPVCIHPLRMWWPAYYVISVSLCIPRIKKLIFNVCRNIPIILL